MLQLFCCRWSHLTWIRVVSPQQEFLVIIRVERSFHHHLAPGPSRRHEPEIEGTVLECHLFVCNRFGSCLSFNRRYISFGALKNGVIASGEGIMIKRNPILWSLLQVLRGNNVNKTLVLDWPRTVMLGACKSVCCVRSIIVGRMSVDRLLYTGKSWRNSPREPRHTCR